MEYRSILYRCCTTGIGVICAILETLVRNIGIKQSADFMYWNFSILTNGSNSDCKDGAIFCEKVGNDL